MTLIKKPYYPEEEVDEIYYLLCNMSGAQVLRLFTDYFGMQLFDSGFIEFLGDEGIIELIEEGDNED